MHTVESVKLRVRADKRSFTRLSAELTSYVSAKCRNLVTFAPKLFAKLALANGGGKHTLRRSSRTALARRKTKTTDTSILSKLSKYVSGAFVCLQLWITVWCGVFRHSARHKKRPQFVYFARTFRQFTGHLSKHGQEKFGSFRRAGSIGSRMTLHFLSLFFLKLTIKLNQINIIKLIMNGLCVDIHQFLCISSLQKVICYYYYITF